MTDIMITMGPACDNDAFIRYAIDELGLHRFRFNMAYPDYSQQAMVKMRKRYGYRITIYEDFPGERARVLMPAHGVLPLAIGDKLRFSLYDNSELPWIVLPDLHRDALRAGQRIVVSDGAIVSRIVKVEPNREAVTVLIEKASRPLRHNGACCIRGVNLSISSFSENDRQLLSRTVSDDLAPDWVMLSFVSSPDSIRQTVKWLHDKGIRAMAKIECSVGVRNLLTIAEVVDGILIGRGDLFSGINEEDFGVSYADACSALSACTAEDCETGIGTFFLREYSETMTASAQEVFDLHHADSCGIDFIMLSKETVNSSYPRETLEFAHRLLQTGASQLIQKVLRRIRYIGRNKKPWVVCLEGPNGAGKTTLAKRISHEMGIPYKLAVPELMMSHELLKKYMLSKANLVASALFFISGIIEVKSQLIAEGFQQVILDRSMWSTFAALYAIDESVCSHVLELLWPLRNEVLFPQRIIVLRASRDTCRERIAGKPDGGIFDEESDETFHRKNRFYEILSSEYGGLTWIDTDALSADEIFAIVRDRGFCIRS